MGRDYNFWVYIVTNDNDSVVYTGVTNNLPPRVAEHRTGAVSDSPPNTVVTNWSIEHCTDALDAITREKQINNWSRAKKAKLITKLNPRWSDLADDIF
ncbi:MAG TPA: GIY-YIG nuclease family protein [Chthoniobacterales bacterium]|nr:GIY-YIG nuclease family protein [Chthoniobacterales bacterium]